MSERTKTIFTAVAAFTTLGLINIAAAKLGEFLGAKAAEVLLKAFGVEPEKTV